MATPTRKEIFAKLDLSYLDLQDQLECYLNHFPQHERYAMCQRLRNISYDVYELIIECGMLYHKKTAARDIRIKIETLHMLLRLSYKKGYLAYKNGRKTNSGILGRQRLESISTLHSTFKSHVEDWLERVAPE